MNPPASSYRCVDALALMFALAGFGIAQPVFEVLAHTPVFLAARQNTVGDIWALTMCLGFVLPTMLAIPACMARDRYPRWSRLYLWFVSSILAGLLIAQLLRLLAGHSTMDWLNTGFGGLGFILIVVCLAVPLAYLLLYTRWKLLASVTAVIALFFPVQFLLFSPVIDEIRGSPQSTLSIPGDIPNPPDIVFLLLDELPVSTIMDNESGLDAALFPGFDRLRQISDWFVNTTSVADGTTDAVPSILTGLYPRERLSEATIAEQPVNLFTLLRHHYDFNVAETITGLCPQDKCPRPGDRMPSRFKALIGDLTAIYLHKVSPEPWREFLPDVESSWSGFFAEKQVFFPEGWSAHVGAQTLIDRPEYIRRFIASIHRSDRPTLNFLHVLFPHGPMAYLPDGENYGLSYLPGKVENRWEDHQWSRVSARQRYFLQVQLADRLLSDLLDHLEHSSLLDDSLVVVVADHGLSFKPGDAARDLTVNNADSLLRVPLFIKAPGQRTGRRVEAPAMTIDIVPTMLSHLNVGPGVFEFDGLDLNRGNKPVSRPRYASSHNQHKLVLIEETRLSVDQVIAENRADLKLDSESSALWDLGPFDVHRGQPSATVCEPVETAVRYRMAKFKPLPNTDPERLVPAFVNGVVTGKALRDESFPFIITDRDLIVGSGYTWKFRDRWRTPGNSVTGGASSHWYHPNWSNGPAGLRKFHWWWIKNVW
jgi:hypothetical protein